MSTDRYTRTILTIIAAALVWLCVVLTPIGTPLFAQPTLATLDPSVPLRVVIAGWEGSGPRIQGNAGAPAVLTFMDLRSNPLPTSAAR